MSDLTHDAITAINAAVNSNYDPHALINRFKEACKKVKEKPATLLSKLQPNTRYLVALAETQHGRLHATFNALVNSEWNLQAEQIIDDFEEDIVFSEKFISNLRRLSETALAWEPTYDAIKRAAEDRRSGDAPRRGSSNTRAWVPQDIERAAAALGHPLDRAGKRKKYGALDSASDTSRERHSKRKHSNNDSSADGSIKAILDDYGIDSAQFPAVTPFLDAALERGSLKGVDAEHPRLSPWKHWDQQLEFGAARDLILADMLATNQITVWRGGSPMNASEAEVRMEAVEILKSLDEKEPRLSYIMNTCADLLAKHRQLPAIFEKRMKVEEQAASANITPQGVFVDLHHDTTYGMETLWGGPKLWIIYPPTHANITALTEVYGQTDRLVYCHSQQMLEGGRVILQRDGETILLPPYWPHATLALGGGILSGRQMSFAENIPKELELLDVDIQTVKRETTNGRQAIKQLLSGMLKRLKRAMCERYNGAAADDDDAAAIRAAICRAWSARRHSLRERLEEYNMVRTAATTWRTVLNEGLGREDVRLVACPLCGHEDLDLVAHLDVQHIKSNTQS